jgi:hypothetical protein
MGGVRGEELSPSPSRKGTARATVIASRCQKCAARHRWWPEVAVGSVLVDDRWHFRPLDDTDILLCGKRLH